MKFVFVPFAAVLMLATPSLAQQQPDNSRPAKLNPNGAPTDQQKSGTAPGGTGSTGWSGSNVKKQEDSTPPNPGATGSDLATGLDLKGPPQHYDGSATPE